MKNRQNNMKADLCFRTLSKRLEPIAGDASYEARDILEMVCHVDDRAFPLFLLHGSVTEAWQAEIERIVSRRETGEPLAYILEKSWFYGLPFHVTSDCLIPQADTEIVTEKLISHLSDGARFADICTGSGCIALAALSQTKNTHAVGFDLSEGALAVARKNAERFSLTERFTAVHADVFAPDFLADAGMFDVIVSNPPYIRSDVIPSLSEEVLAEPHMALDGGEDGLLFYRRLLDVCPAHIKKGGRLLLEIGYDQRQDLQSLCRERNLFCEFYSDFGGNNRVCAVSL